MALSFGSNTDPGPRTGGNQDAVAIIPAAGRPTEAALVIVADGLGGGNAGDFASQLTVQVIGEMVLPEGAPPAPAQVPGLLRAAIQAANQAVLMHSSDEGREGMSSTVVLALVIDETVWIASVGDSRAYLVRGGKALQLTEDHTWVNHQVRSGLLSPEEAAKHALGHVLERAIGAEPDIEVDVLPDEMLEDGDTLVLCSDGLYNALSGETIARLVDGLSAQEAADLLLSKALAAPARDNVTVAVLKFSE